MINIHLYGKLRKLAENDAVTGDSVISLDYRENETLGDLLARAGIGADQISTLFMNRHLAYAKDTVPADNTRVAVFTRGMGLLDGALYLKIDDMLDRQNCVKCFQ